MGAAAFLMPARGLKQRVHSQGVSIQILEQLAEDYAVSMQAVCLRLRRLRIWKGQLSVWARLPDGRFRFETAYGGIDSDWYWIDE